jgi:ribonuclease BN (tRNA processing enzyme)
MKLVPLGVNGFFPSYGRNTMSYLVLTEEEAIILDAGTGLSRLLEPRIKDLLRSHRSLNIFLSHYHLDHVVGLSYLPEVWDKRRIKLFAPSVPLVEADAAFAIERLLHPPLFSLTVREFPSNVELTPVTTLQLSLGKTKISIRKQKHPGGSIAIKLDNSIAYVTDTVVDLDSVSFLQGVNFLLHEVWLTDEEAKEDAIEAARHSYCGGVRKIAIQSNVKHLMPIHLHPKHDGEQLNQIAAQLQAPDFKVILPKEGQTYEIA